MTTKKGRGMGYHTERNLVMKKNKEKRKNDQLTDLCCTYKMTGGCKKGKLRDYVMATRERTDNKKGKKGGKSRSKPQRCPGGSIAHKNGKATPERRIAHDAHPSSPFLR